MSSPFSHKTTPPTVVASPILFFFHLLINFAKNELMFFCQDGLLSVDLQAKCCVFEIYSTIQSTKLKRSEYFWKPLYLHWLL